MQEATLLSKAGVDDYCEDQPFQYQDFSIKNTFVHGFIYGRPPSLEACHERRRSTSCPPGASPKNECLKEEDFCADSCSRFTHEGPAGRPFSSRTTSCSFEGASSAPSDPGEGSDIYRPRTSLLMLAKKRFCRPRKRWLLDSLYQQALLTCSY